MRTRGNRLATEGRERDPQPYANPYLAGLAPGLVLLSAFVGMGRGLGASGAFNSTVAWVVSLVAPSWASANGFLSRYLDGETHPLKAWLVFEVIGVFAGALLCGLLARRVAWTVEKGPRVTARTRLALAFAGGVLMANGAALARCTGVDERQGPHRRGARSRRTA